MKEKVMNFLKLAKQFILTNKSLVMKMIAVIIVIIAIIVIASSLNGTKVGNAASNSHNLGLAVQDGSWIYYVAVDDDEPVGIYKVKNNGKKTEKVADGYMYNLNIVDNYIYCLEYNEDEERNDLIKIKTNGKNKETLARDIDENQIMLVDKWVYYYKDNSLYRVKTSGTDRESSYNLAAGKKGDGVYETSNNYQSNSSWFGAYSYFPNTSYPFFIRGGYYNDNSAGVIYFSNSIGTANSNNSFRVVLSG